MSYRRIVRVVTVDEALSLTPSAGNVLLELAFGASGGGGEREVDGRMVIAERGDV